MFTLRTARGRRALLAVLVLAFTMIACTQTIEPDPAVGGADEQSGENSESEEQARDDAEEQEEEQEERQEEEGSEQDEEMAEQPVALAGASLRTCHERNDAGGNSDVVVALEFDGVEAGTSVEVSWQSSTQGTGAASGVVDDAGTALVLLPAVEFFEEFAVDAVSVDGAAVDPAGNDLTHTVPDNSGSDCSNHPNM